LTSIQNKRENIYSYSYTSEHHWNKGIHKRNFSATLVRNRDMSYWNRTLICSTLRVQTRSKWKNNYPRWSTDCGRSGNSQLWAPDLSTQSSTCKPAWKLPAAVGHPAAGISADPSDYLQKWWKKSA
jgi:hypothetical protein